MGTLIPYDGWSSNEDKYIGRYRDENGKGLSGLYLRVQKCNIIMCIMGNGHNLRSYKFPKVEIPFESPMHSWRNMLLCGGFHMRDINGKSITDDEVILEAVLNKKKPVGFMVNNQEKTDEFIKRIEEVNLGIKDPNQRFIYHSSKREGKEWFDLGVACPGRVKDYFDLRLLIETYEIFYEKYKQFKKIKNTHPLLNKYDLEEIMELNDHYLSDFLIGWDYCCPCGNVALIKCGLLLGYPIESTFSCIVQ